MGAEGAVVSRYSDLPLGQLKGLGVRQHGAGLPLALLLHNTQF